MIKGITEEEFNKERSYKDITKEKLKELYINKNLTQKECSEYFNCGTTTLGKRLNKWNIKKGYGKIINIDKEKLKELYIDRNYTRTECAKYFNCERTTVGRRLKEWNIFKETKIDIDRIELKELYINKNLTQKECSEYFNCSIRTIEKRVKKWNLNKDNKKIVKSRKDINKNININKEELKELYINKGYTIYECSDHFNCSATVIKNRISKYDIKKDIKYNISKKELKNIYINKNYTLRETANYFNCSSNDPIEKRLKKWNLNKDITYNINKEELKELYIDKDYTLKEISDYYNCERTTIMNRLNKWNIKKEIEIEINKEELKELYIDKDYTISGCARYFNCSSDTIRKRLIKFNIKINEHPFHSSNKEKEVYNFIKDNYFGKIIRGDRQILEGKEIDIYLPDKNIAIEFNGLYWHSEKNGIGKKYHLNKTNRCLEKNIRLIHLFSDEWNNRKEIVKSKILYLINNKRKNIKKYKINKVNYCESKKFINNYNIDYLKNINKNYLNLGLFKENELIALLSIININNNWEIKSFTIKYNKIDPTNGFDLLFNYLKNNYSFNKIIVKTDRRWYNDLIYSNFNFNIIKNLPPKFYNSDSRKRLQKINNKNSYFKVWDCGSYLLEYNN
jgi:sarcosine oxidase delta subunit